MTNTRRKDNVIDIGTSKGEVETSNGDAVKVQKVRIDTITGLEYRDIRGRRLIFSPHLAGGPGWAIFDRQSSKWWRGDIAVPRYGVRQPGGFWEVVEYQNTYAIFGPKFFTYEDFESHVRRAGLDSFEYAVWYLVFWVIEAEWSQAAEQLTPRLIEEEQQQLVHEKERRLEYEKRKKSAAAEQKKILELLRTPT